MRRTAVYAAVVALAVSVLGLVAAPAQASPSDTDANPTAGATVTVTRELRIDAKYRDAFRQAQIARATRAGIRQDPPLGGCDYSDAHGTVTSFYTNGVLTGTDTTYFTSIICFTTAPGQSMEGLISQASLWKNSVKIDQDPTPGICNDCNLASGDGHKICAGQANCAGTYWVGHVATRQPGGLDHLPRPANGSS